MKNVATAGSVQRLDGKSGHTLWLSGAGSHITPLLAASHNHHLTPAGPQRAGGLSRISLMCDSAGELFGQYQMINQFEQFEKPRHVAIFEVRNYRDSGRARN